MDSERSLYEIILRSLKDDELPEGFSLPADDEESHFADGAIDGISLYHSRTPELDADGARLMIRAVKYASEEDYYRADASFSELGKKFRAICIVDFFQNYIIKNSERLSAGKLFRSARHLILESRNRESVKFGLCILELLSEPSEQIKNAIRRLGLSDEFTIFAIWNMKRWFDGNFEIFKLAQKVHGWGRIHAVHALVTETDPEIDAEAQLGLENEYSQIRNWLLLDGVHNNVSPAYSALTVWRKARVEEMLKGWISREQFTAIGEIISALTDEGPVPGISEIENVHDVFLYYLVRREVYEFDVKDYETVLEIKAWSGGQGEDLSDVIEKCSEFLSSPECEETILAAVSRGEGLDLAEFLGLDYKDAFFECLKNDFDGHFRNCIFLMFDEDHRNALLDLFRDHLPLEHMQRDPENGFWQSVDDAVCDRLEAIVDALRLFSDSGVDLIVSAMWASEMGLRDAALRAVEEWTKDLKSPIWEISADIYSELDELYEAESDEERKEHIKMLLEGITPVSDGEEDPDDA